ncbi:hypothetical protein [Neisseria shayeganii]|uniref:Uncharacterized protein n=1 Tax=Neisseria shayeganii 871 TaxID=1032488 RepID=G4CLK7_9NEIS|nr:hypothetical protein [Neisseria shayeganii]EGY51284.1 hypothetical protein HMPREF9371_2498 [Neisseria shayeganii 871]
MKFENKHDFFSYFLDDNWTVSKKLLKTNNWHAIPVPNTLTLIETEWFAKNIFLYGQEYLEYCFEYNGNISVSIVNNSADNLMGTEFNNSHKYIIITNQNLDFLYFKNQNNLYHLFCGTPDFVFGCINCSLNMAKKIFFSYGVDSFDEGSDEYHYLIGIWDTYSSNLN